MIRNNVIYATHPYFDTGRVDHNLEGAQLSLFVDPVAYNFHLAPGADAAINKGVRLKKAGRDVDGRRHYKGRPDLGADEYGR